MIVSGSSRAKFDCARLLLRQFDYTGEEVKRPSQQLSVSFTKEFYCFVTPPPGDVEKVGLRADLGCLPYTYEAVCSGQRMDFL